MAVTEISPLYPPAAALSAIGVVLRNHGQALPDPCFAMMNEAQPVVPQIERSAEALYAAVTLVEPGDARDAFAVLCVQLVSLCVQGMWGHLGTEDRGRVMIGACARLVGLGTQDESLDPEPLEQLVNPPPADDPAAA